MVNFNQYTLLEVSAVVMRGDHCEAVPGVIFGDVKHELGEGESLIYTVYGRTAEGYAEAIDDRCSVQEAMELARHLQRKAQHLEIRMV